ncbi:MAG: DUF5615 family PIN-like protein [Luteolibacter sp.]
MNFLLDENFPKSACAIVEAAGHQVFDFRLIGKEGSPDLEVINIAKEKKAVILTTDRDFFHTLGRLNPGHHGILVIALKRPTRDAIIDRLQWFLNRFTESDISGRYFQLRDEAWMVYPPFGDSQSDQQ